MPMSNARKTYSEDVPAAAYDDDVIDDSCHGNSDVLKAEPDGLRNSNHVGREG